MTKLHQVGTRGVAAFLLPLEGNPGVFKGYLRINRTFFILHNSLILKENMVEGMGFEPMIP